MRVAKNLSPKRVLLSVLIAMVIVFNLTQCDDYQVEVPPENTPSESIQNALLITPKHSGIFDLRSFVNAGPNRSISITTQPNLGVLESLGSDLLRYSVKDGVVSGTDKLLISIFSADQKLERKDSIVFIISQDSVAVNCDFGVIVQDDQVYNVTEPTDINVLLNDTVCAVLRQNLTVRIPEDALLNGLPIKAQFGKTEVLGNGKIRYTPDSSFRGNDKFLYKVVKPQNLPQNGNPETAGYGWVHISIPIDPCKDIFQVEDDLFEFKLDTLNRADTLHLNTNHNDILCIPTFTSLSFNAKTNPQGSLYLGPNYTFKYLLPPTLTIGQQDQFTYEVCVGSVCKQANVTIALK
jgi:hypothetical protein